MNVHIKVLREAMEKFDIDSSIFKNILEKIS